MKRYICIFFVLAAASRSTGSPVKLSRKSRIQHGSYGIAYGGASLVGFYTLFKLGGLLRESMAPYSLPGRRMETLKDSFHLWTAFSGIGLLTYIFARQSSHSFSLFFEKDEESPSEKIVEMGAVAKSAQQLKRKEEQ